MKKYFLFIILVAVSAILYSQSTDLVFHTPKGERFYVEINGVRQFSEPTTNLKVRYYNKTSARIKIVMEDVALGSIEKAFSFQSGREITYRIKRIVDKYKVEWEKELPNTHHNNKLKGQEQVNYTTPEGVTIQKPVTGKEYLKTYEGNKGCAEVLSDKDFEIYLRDANQKHIGQSWFNHAIKNIDGKCFSVAQVKVVLKMFSLDMDKVDLAIAFYPNVFDQDDYIHIFHLIENHQELARLKKRLKI